MSDLNDDINLESRHPSVVVRIKTSSQKGGVGAELTVTSDLFAGMLAVDFGASLADAVRKEALRQWGELQAALDESSGKKLTDELAGSLAQTSKRKSAEQVRLQEVATLADGKCSYCQGSGLVGMLKSECICVLENRNRLIDEQEKALKAEEEKV
ncbi:MAG TPA: hypothetical protein VJB57_10055 [Dehalococcoidia bacterium]|nr:hypothetical protein [Dehalococcoidia bacterium]